MPGECRQGTNCSLRLSLFCLLPFLNWFQGLAYFKTIPGMFLPQSLYPYFFPGPWSDVSALHRACCLSHSSQVFTQPPQVQSVSPCTFFFFFNRGPFVPPQNQPHQPAQMSPSPLYSSCLLLASNTQVCICVLNTTKQTWHLKEGISDLWTRD